MAPSSLSVLALQLLLFAHSSALPATVIEVARPDYDYVIVGGGTSGNTIANRLSEDRRTSVLVIEAGPILDDQKEFDEVLVQATFDRIDRARTAYTWPNITLEPVEGLNGRTGPVLTAKIVGGGSAVNGKIFARGSKRDYDDWARYLKDDGWGWKSIINYFKKSETFTPPLEEYRKKGNVTWDWSVHGRDGPISSTFPEQYFPSVDYLIAAEKGLGIPQKKDQGDGDPIGSIWHPVSIRPKVYTRSYSKNEYYDPAKRRPNLHLLAENTVTRILFAGRRVIGVEYAVESGQQKKTVRVNREVILAAGSVKSPQLLQVSGVGPKKLSKIIGVPSIVDLPVGDNYQNHGTLALGYNLTISDEERMWTDKTNKTFMDQQYAQFIANRTGYYTATSNNHMALLSVPMIHGNGYKALLSRFTGNKHEKYLRTSADSTTANSYRRQMDITLQSMFTNEIAVDEAIVGGRGTVLVKPLSRGYIEAKSANIWDPPTVSARTFSHPLDIENVLASLRMMRKILARPEAKPLNPVETDPGLQIQDDDRLKDHIRKNMAPGSAHGCCTVPMGTVLDSKLRVLGVKNLRVVDASSWPIIPGAHATQCTAYAVAERAADLIKNSR